MSIGVWLHASMLSRIYASVCALGWRVTCTLKLTCLWSADCPTNTFGIPPMLPGSRQYSQPKAQRHGHITILAPWERKLPEESLRPAVRLFCMAPPGGLCCPSQRTPSVHCEVGPGASFRGRSMTLVPFKAASDCYVAGPWGPHHHSHETWKGGCACLSAQLVTRLSSVITGYVISVPSCKQSTATMATAITLL
jgi:hypothetical protein